MSDEERLAAQLAEWCATFAAEERQLDVVAELSRHTQ